MIALAGWALTQQMTRLIEELPGYRQNVLAKIRDVRQASQGGSVEALQKTMEEKCRRARHPRSRHSAIPLFVVISIEPRP
jgi:hypothetical protein